MRTYDVAYVKNPATPQLLPPLESMDLREITKNYLTTCAKSNGMVSSCRKCDNRCKFGQRAVELAFGSKEANVTPLNDGILHRMRMAQGMTEPVKPVEEKKTEENKTVEEKTTVKEGKTVRKNNVVDEWYITAGKQNDPTAYIMEKFGLIESSAKQKVYDYRYKHPDLVKDLPVPITDYAGPRPRKKELKEMEKPVVAKTAVVENTVISTEKESTEKTKAVGAPVEHGEDFVETLRRKISMLMEDQKNYIEMVEKFTKLRDGVKDKIEALELCISTFSKD